MRTAGPGGPETAACKAFCIDVVEIFSLLHQTLANAKAHENEGFPPDGIAWLNTLIEMCVTRAIDSCLAYVSSVLQLIHRQHPEALKSKEKIELDYILQFGSMDELVRALVERKVHALSYRSLTDLDEYLSERLGLSLFSNEDQRVRAVLLVDVRNLIVHNRGFVNRVFKERNPKSTQALGDRVRFNESTTESDLLFLIEWVMDLDIRLAQKFGIPTSPRIPGPKLADIS